MIRMLVALMLVAVGAAAAQDKAEVPFFGNAKCPVSGKDAARNIWVEKDGQRVYLCSVKCKEEAQKDIAKHLAAAYPAGQIKDLKNEKCPIMGGQKASPEHVVDFQGHRVQFCCKRCAGRFAKEPLKHLTLLTRPDVVPLKNATCPVMADEAVEPDIFVVYKKKLVGLCCTDCVDTFQEDPEKHLATAEGRK